MGILHQSPDLWVAEFFASHRVDALTSLSTHLMNVGISPYFLVLTAVAWILATIRWGFWHLGIGVLLAIGLSNLLVAILKEIFGRERPPDHLVLVNVDSYAFPSTHASMTVAVAVVVLAMAPWRSRVIPGTVAAIVVAGIGVCLVYLGSHWTSDVLAGWLLGGLSGAVVVKLLTPRPALV